MSLKDSRGNENLTLEVKQSLNGLKTEAVSENELKDHENIGKGNISARDKAVSTIKW